MKFITRIFACLGVATLVGAVTFGDKLGPAVAELKQVVSGATQNVVECTTPGFAERVQRRADARQVAEFEQTCENLAGKIDRIEQANPNRDRDLEAAKTAEEDAREKVTWLSRKLKELRQNRCLNQVVVYGKPRTKADLIRAIERTQQKTRAAAEERQRLERICCDHQRLCQTLERACGRIRSIRQKLARLEQDRLREKLDAFELELEGRVAASDAAIRREAIINAATATSQQAETLDAELFDFPDNPTAHQLASDPR